MGTIYPWRVLIINGEYSLSVDSTKKIAVLVFTSN
ncbi:hypothetical protein YPPY54_3617, partial [Yersinia pestis PY-54]